MPPGGGSTLESVAGKGFVDLAALQFAVLLAQKQLGRAMAGPVSISCRVRGVATGSGRGCSTAADWLVSGVEGKGAALGPRQRASGDIGRHAVGTPRL